MKKLSYSFLILFLLLSLLGLKPLMEIQWKQIDDGLYLTEYKSPQKSSVDNSIITILKINPEKYSFNLFSSKETKQSMNAKEWAVGKNQIAVINAGMFRGDGLTNLGYMKNYDFINNGKLNNDNTILAFNRKDKSVPLAQIIDLKRQNWDVLKGKYNSFTQSIRMIDLEGNNKWSQQNKMWSMVVIAMDKQDHVLFIFCRSPYTVHDFINILLEAPLNIKNMMYLEGGPEASFYLKHHGVEIVKMGSYETSFMENNNNNNFWTIPNVIGISKTK